MVALSFNNSVDDIVNSIREQRPESKAGKVEVKWYISKMKKEGVLDSDGNITEYGKTFVNSIGFRTSKTLKPIDAVVNEVKESEEEKLFKFSTSSEGNYKERDNALKQLAKLLKVPYEKKGEGKQGRIERLSAAMA